MTRNYWLLLEKTDATRISKGFYSVNADTSKKRHNVPKECLC